MVRREPQFGNQMDAAVAGNRKHRAQAERRVALSPLEAHADFLLALIADHPDLTLDEIVAVMRKRRIGRAASLVLITSTCASKVNTPRSPAVLAGRRN